MFRQAYHSDLTDAQWVILEPLLPPPDEEAPNRKYELREIVNAILYVLLLLIIKFLETRAS